MRIDLRVCCGPSKPHPPWIVTHYVYRDVTSEPPTIGHLVAVFYEGRWRNVRGDSYLDMNPRGDHRRSA